MRCIGAMDAFERNESEDSLTYALPGPIWVKDLSKYWDGRIMPLEQAQQNLIEEGDDEEVEIFRFHNSVQGKKKAEQAESVVPIAA